MRGGGGERIKGLGRGGRSGRAGCARSRVPSARAAAASVSRVRSPGELLPAVERERESGRIRGGARVCHDCRPVRVVRHGADSRRAWRQVVMRRG